MKNLVIILFTLIIPQILLANQPLLDAITFFEKATEKSDYFESLNKFERIISLGNSDWLPYYYSSFCLTSMARICDIEKVDEYCDNAESFLEKAIKLDPDSSEIFCLKAMIASTRIRVNYEERGFRYVILSHSFLEKAESLNDNNPRIYYLKGMNTYNTPAAIGGGAKAAMPYFEKALTLFNKQIELENSVRPHWGRLSCEEIINVLKNNENK